MENIEERLREYRLRKRRQERIENIKTNIRRFLMLGVKVENPAEKDETETADATTAALSIDKRSIRDKRLAKHIKVSAVSDDELNSITSSHQLIPDNDHLNELPKENRLYKYTMWLLCFIFWVTVYAIAIELQFGTVYFILSLLIGVYLNTRTGPKQPNEISAYSVFNRNCESIDGTLKAEQFERELGIR